MRNTRHFHSNVNSTKPHSHEPLDIHVARARHDASTPSFSAKEWKADKTLTARGNGNDTPVISTELEIRASIMTHEGKMMIIKSGAMCTCHEKNSFIQVNFGIGCSFCSEEKFAFVLTIGILNSFLLEFECVC